LTAATPALRWAGPEHSMAQHVTAWQQQRTWAATLPGWCLAALQVFTAVTSIATIGLYISYVIPVFLRITIVRAALSSALLSRGCPERCSVRAALGAAQHSAQQCSMQHRRAAPQQSTPCFACLAVLAGPQDV
jgi:hypothetical protein